MDIEQAKRMYLAGATLADIAAAQGVAPSTVGLNLKKAGVEIRSGGHRPDRRATSARIAQLAASGPPLNEVAAQNGMGRWATRHWYKESLKEAERARMGRWHRILLDALDQRPVIAVAATIRSVLGREPTRSELTAARRAAGRLAAAGLVRQHHVTVPIGASYRRWVVLSRPQITELTELDRRRLAENAADNGRAAYETEMARRNRAESLTTLRRNLTRMAKTVADLDVGLLTIDEAADLADRVERLSTQLRKAQGRLRRRTGS